MRRVFIAFSLDLTLWSPRKRWIAAWKAIALVPLLASVTTSSAVEVHVAPYGNDTNSGTPSSPFASLARARSAIRAAKQRGGPTPEATIWIHRGDYALTSTFELGADDGGATNLPVVYRAVDGQEVRLIGGRRLPVQAFQPASAPGILQRLEAAVRTHVLRADLRALGVTNLGTLPDQFSGAVGGSSQ